MRNGMDGLLGLRALFWCSLLWQWYGSEMPLASDREREKERESLGGGGYDGMTAALFVIMLGRGGERE